MSQTIEAIVDAQGRVRLLEAVHLNGARRALVTILEDGPTDNLTMDLAYREMSEDEAAEADALEWAESTIGDIRDEAR
jgi:hypothetical protein